MDIGKRSERFFAASEENLACLRVVRRDVADQPKRGALSQRRMSSFCVARDAPRNGRKRRK
jgi:hypothetical protein